MSAVKATAPSLNRMRTAANEFCNTGPVSNASFSDFPRNGAAESNTIRTFFTFADFL